MSRVSNTRGEWSVAYLKGTLTSYLRPGSIRKVTLQQFDGVKRRVKTSFGMSEHEIREAIAACISGSPGYDAERVAEIRRKYLQ
jgi:hypothetical protein